MSEISGANVGWLGFGGISGGTLGMPGLFGTPTGEETKKESTMKRKDAEAENAGQPAAVWPNKVPRRIEPVSVASSSTARPPAAPPMPEERPADMVGNDDDSEVDPAHLEELRQLSEEQQQALIDDYFAKKEAHDDAVRMLERGSDRRRLGDFHKAMVPERLAEEREILNELREARADVDDFSALMEDALRDYEEELLEMHEEAIRAWTEAADEVEAAGFSVVELERQYEANRARGRRRARAAGGAEGGEEGGEEEEEEEEDEGMELEDCQGHVSATTGELCRKCRARHALMATDLAEAERGLCYVCAAEAELDARAPVAKKHGKVSAADCVGLRLSASDGV